MADIFPKLQAEYKAGGSEKCLKLLSNMGEKDVFIRLVEAKLAEESDQIHTAEEIYLDILESSTSGGTTCPLGLYHYLGFIARTRGVDDSLSVFEDLCLAESEHVVPELYSAFAIGIIWPSSLPRDTRLELVRSVFASGLSRAKGSSRIDLVVALADLLAFSGNELKKSELELSKLGDCTDRKIWSKWEEILLAFNADLETVRGLARMRDGLNKEDKEQLVEDSTGVLTISDHPTAPVVDSWLLSCPNGNVINSIVNKFKLDSLVPESSVLEQVMGLPPQKAGLMTTIAEEDLRDGGDDETNHVYRPDVTKMLRYIPQDDVEQKSEVSSVLKNLIGLLPARKLKHSNAQYMADQCIRLLVSLNLPSRVITEETYNNVDKRTRHAYDQKYIKQLPQIIAPTLAVKEKEKPEEAKVKKEEIFDPVEYYNKKA